MLILFPAPGAGVDFNPTQEEYLSCAKTIIGDDSLPLEILGVSKWFINETVAEYYSDGNIFCMGDAVHRHPPLNGLGSNTCIQDAYNLAWKIAYVLKGKASASLLDSYSLERQPVGAGVITRANQGLRDHVPVWESLGMMGPSLEARKKEFAQLSEATPEGVARRARLQGTSIAALNFRYDELRKQSINADYRVRGLKTSLWLLDSSFSDIADTMNSCHQRHGSRVPRSRDRDEPTLRIPSCISCR